jgi:hypothetical protein
MLDRHSYPRRPKIQMFVFIKNKPALHNISQFLLISIGDIRGPLRE